MNRGRSKGNKYQGRGRGRHEPMKPKGLFSSGVWHCDCNPRLPANRFKVKKEGPNEGRWFYCCQKDKQIGCNFFLWESDAEPRMQAAVLNNSTTEPGQLPAVPAPSASTTESETSQNYKLAPPRPLPAQPLQIPAKRKLPWLEIDNDASPDNADDEPFPWSPTPAEEQALTNAVDHATSHMPAPETPRKAQKTTALTTPQQAGTAYANGLPTPNTSNRKLDYLSVTPFADVVTPQTTPTPARFRDALSGEASSSTGDLSGEVFSYLVTTAAAHLTPDEAKGLRGILDKHTLKMTGISNGRDVLRTGIQTREETIAKLRQRVAAQESEMESQKAVARHLRQMLEENRKALDEITARKP